MAGNEPHTSRPSEPTDGDVSVLSSNEPGLSEDMRLASPDAEKRSPLSRPIVAVALFLVLVVIGGLMVSSQEKVPVPPTVADAVEDEGPTDFERREAATEALEQLGLTHIVVYASVRGASTVDLATGQVVEVRTNSVLSPGRHVVLPSNGASYVVDAAAPSRADVLATDASVIATQTGGRLAVVGAGPPAGGSGSTRFVSVVDRPAGEDLSASQVVVSDELDPAAVFFAAPGLGAVVAQPDGSTTVYDLTGARELSEHRVVAANVAFRVEVRCGGPCSTYLVGLDDEVKLPDGFDADALLDPTDGLTVSIAPSGRWLLLYDTATPAADRTGSGARPEGVAAQLFEVASGELLPIAAGRTGSPTWSDDGANVAWLDPNGNDAALVVVGVNDRSVTMIDLDALGAPNRDGDALVLIPSP